MEREEDAIDEELIGGEEIGLRERRVANLPELKFGGIADAASSSSATGWRKRPRLWVLCFAGIHGDFRGMRRRKMKEEEV